MRSVVRERSSSWRAVKISVVKWPYLKTGEPVLLPGDTVEVAVAKGRERVQQVAVEAKPIGEHGGDRTKEQGVVNTLPIARGSTNAEYLTARIARDALLSHNSARRVIKPPSVTAVLREPFGAGYWLTLRSLGWRQGCG